ncbi:hypothetical protein C8R44DRAFT_794162 [Mycena epipterygia]|nr:hypothetical protein C8R44DRAFT_794162 [Mycena epipterygia]
MNGLDFLGTFCDVVGDQPIFFPSEGPRFPDAALDHRRGVLNRQQPPPLRSETEMVPRTLESRTPGGFLGCHYRFLKLMQLSRGVLEIYGVDSCEGGEDRDDQVAESAVWDEAWQAPEQKRD